MFLFDIQMVPSGLPGPGMRVMVTRSYDFLTGLWLIILAEQYW